MIDPKLEIKKVTTEIREMVEENRIFFVRETEKVLKAVEDFEKRYLESVKVAEPEQSKRIVETKIEKEKEVEPAQEQPVAENCESPNLHKTTSDDAPTKSYSTVEEIQSDKKQLELVLDHLKKDSRWSALPKLNL